jgi:hypothetical protein
MSFNYDLMELLSRPLSVEEKRDLITSLETALDSDTPQWRRYTEELLTHLRKSLATGSPLTREGLRRRALAYLGREFREAGRE